MRPLISLDIFDTALFRDVFMPTDIFDVVEQEVGNNFKKLRLEAQRRASSISIFCDLVDIYKNLPQFNMKEEIRAELLGCKPNPYILNMYNTLNADFIFISDMYLPSNVLIAMLKKCGYLNPRVFVSCELKACKGDGKLFTKVENLIGRKIDKHIGDNYNADIEGAKKVGIPEVEYIGPSIYKREVVTPVLKSARLRKFLIDNELSSKSIEEKIGYLFAPLTLAFTQKVLDEAKDNQTIFFNARDGFLMYIVARWILKTKKKIKYCRFSRKSCLFANLQTDLPITHFNNQSSLQFLKQQRVENIEDFFKLFGFKHSGNYFNVLKIHGIDSETPLEFHPKKADIIRDLILFLQKEIYEKAKEERMNFLKYLENLGIKNNDIFVDIGYRGTMQGIIKRIANLDLKGKYVYTFDSSEGNYYGVKYEKTSFLSSKFVKFFAGATLEIVYTEPIGTVTGYDKEGKPILLKDLKVRKNISKKLIKGVLEGCKELYEKKINISREDCEKIIVRYMDTPTLEEAKFGNQEIFENGSNGNESITWFNEELIRKGKIKECFNKSYWRPAFKLLLANSNDFKDLESKIK